MTKLKITSAKKLICFLEKKDFEVRRQSGSHVILAKNDIILSIPFHQGKDLGRGLIAALLRDGDIDFEDYQKNI